MERDFMGLNSKDASVIVVKEETVEVSQDSAFSKGLAGQWPFSNTLSLSSGRQAGEIQKNVNPVRQGGTHFSVPAYAVQQSAHQMQLHHGSNQAIPVNLSHPFFKNHFAGAGQNFCASPMKQQFLGGVPVTAPHSILPPVGAFTGATDAWLNSKPAAAAAPASASAQLTIFYGGMVNVYEDISPEKAQAIMFLAGNGTAAPSSATQPRAQVQVPTSKVTAGDVVFVNQPMGMQPCSALSSPMSVSSHPVGHSGGGSIYGGELAKPTGSLVAPVGKVDPPKVVTSHATITTSSMIPSAVPQARKASLARFLEKRKERVMSAAPYSLGKDSAQCTGKTGSNGISFFASSGVSSGNERGVAIHG